MAGLEGETYRRELRIRMQRKKIVRMYFGGVDLGDDAPWERLGELSRDAAQWDMLDDLSRSISKA